MAVYEFVVAVADEIELLRKKEGDIIDVKPYPWVWGRKEVDQYLVILIESARTWNDLRKTFKQKLLEGGYTEYLIKELDPENPTDLAVLNSEIYESPVKYLGGYMERPAVLAKRRYRVTLDNIVALDLDKVRDKDYIYQPFKTIDNIILNTSIDPELVDCVGVTTDEHTEFIVPTLIARNYIRDKYDNSSVGDLI